MTYSLPHSISYKNGLYPYRYTFLCTYNAPHLPNTSCSPWRLTATVSFIENYSVGVLLMSKPRPQPIFMNTAPNTNMHVFRNLMILKVTLN